MNFVKTTVIGGIVFLVPVIIVVAILGKAFQLMLLVATPVDSLIPFDSIGGIALANLLALLGILVVCFIAGVIARSTPAKKIYNLIDSGLLAVPGYAFIKAYTDSMKSGEETMQSLQPVLVTFDDNKQLGFEVDRINNGQVVVYLPGAPNPWSGAIAYFDAERVRKLDLSVSQAINHLRQLGRGAHQMEQQLKSSNF